MIERNDDDSMDEYFFLIEDLADPAYEPMIGDVVSFDPGVDPDSGGLVGTNVILVDAVGTEGSTWGTIKALFAD